MADQPGPNIFRVLGINYELFHSRMLFWLWTPNADHGAGDRFLAKVLARIGLTSSREVSLRPEVKINVPWWSQMAVGRRRGADGHASCTYRKQG